MEKQTKNIITREWIENELRFYNSADIRSMLVLCGVMSLVFLPLTAASVCGLIVWLENIWLKVFSSFLIGVLLSAPVWGNLFSLRIILNERKLLLRGDFEIVTRKVQYKIEKAVHSHTECFLHFSDFREASCIQTTFQLTSQGDEFYLVHYTGQDSVKLMFPARTYEYRES